MNIERARFRESAATSEMLQEDEVARINSRAEKNIGKMKRVTDQNVKKMGEYYEENIELARDGFDQKIVDQRERNIELQGKNHRILADRFHKLEKNFTKKLAYCFRNTKYSSS